MTHVLLNDCVAVRSRVGGICNSFEDTCVPIKLAEWLTPDWLET